MRRRPTSLPEANVGLKRRPIYGPAIHQGGTDNKEDDGRELLKAFNGTAQSGRKSWLLLITLIAYLFVAVTSVTHVDLLLNTPLKMPILQIDVGLRGFFIVAPALFILV